MDFVVMEFQFGIRPLAIFLTECKENWILMVNHAY